jgi:hypothetical protein
MADSLARASLGVMVPLEKSLWGERSAIRSRWRRKAQNSLVKRDDRVAKRLGVGDELDETGSVLQRDDLVRPDVELAIPSLLVAIEERVDESEDLLHYGVLADIIVSLELWSRGKSQ